EGGLEPVRAGEGPVVLPGGHAHRVDDPVEVVRVPPVDLRVLHVRAELAEAPGRALGDVAHLRVHGGEAEVPAPADPDAPQVALAGPEVVGGWRVDRQGIARVRPGQNLEEEGAI